MKLGELIIARNTILSLSKEKVSPKTAYKLLKFLKATSTEEELYKEKFRGLIDIYGEKDTNGHLVTVNDTGFKIKEDTKSEFVEKIAELESTEVDTPEISFTIEDFNEFKLSMSDINSVFVLIKEE